ncbi:MAG: ABC transporter permease [Anaerolineaceae bacterium]|nr:ABC transporter permease [Anaerolineaceae bacterium]
MAQQTDIVPRKTIVQHWIESTIVRYFYMIVLSFLLFGLLLLFIGKDPIQSYIDIFTSTLGSPYGFSEVIVAMTPVLLTGLAVALPSKIMLINVGAEGQLYIGAAFATWGALTFQALPAWQLIPIMMLLGLLGGALWAFIPAYLKSIGLVNETITSLLLNSVAPKIIGFLVFGFWHSAMDTNKTARFVQAARLPTFFGTRVNLGLIFGLVLLIAFWLFMKYSRWGLEMRAIGGNAQAARRNGIPLKTYILVVFCTGGAIAGLAGMVQASGYYGLMLTNFSTGWGFMGFLISWLVGGDPIGIIVMSFIVSLIYSGGNLLQITSDVPYSIINILLALTLFVVLARPSFAKGRK